MRWQPGPYRSSSSSSASSPQVSSLSKMDAVNIVLALSGLHKLHTSGTQQERASCKYHPPRALPAGDNQQRLQRDIWKMCLGTAASSLALIYPRQTLSSHVSICLDSTRAFGVKLRCEHSVCRAARLQRCRCTHGYAAMKGNGLDTCFPSPALRVSEICLGLLKF